MHGSIAIFMLTFAGLASGASIAQEMAPADTELREQLLAMQVEDQRVRTQPASASESGDIGAIDKRHTERLKQIVQMHGWPTRTLVGRDGAAAAFLLAQHADLDPDFQREVLALMEPLVEEGEADAAHFAYLWDRTHAPQRFGTQGRCVGIGRWEPREIEDSELVDTRRASVGLPSMDEYIQKISEFCRQDERRFQPDAK